METQTNFIKVYSTTRIVLTILIFLASVAALFVSNSIVTFFATFLMIGAIAFFLTSCKEWKSTIDNKFYKKEELFFGPDCLTNIKSMVESGNISKINRYKDVNASNIRLDVWKASDKSSSYIQLFIYVPHTYSPITELRKI